jgi:CheY-like chemotaxis protein
MDETTQTPGEETNVAEASTSAVSKKILAVEDDLFLKELLAGKLSDDEFNVFYASNGDEALTIAATELPDVILLDILLPGMSGYDVLEKLKADENTKNIPVIILSNFGQPEDIEKGKRLGAVDFLVKANNSLDAIVNRVREIASSPQA